jgi:hypothetical protein
MHKILFFLINSHSTMRMIATKRLFDLIKGRSVEGGGTLIKRTWMMTMTITYEIVFADYVILNRMSGEQGSADDEFRCL